METVIFQGTFDEVERRMSKFMRDTTISEVVSVTSSTCRVEKKIVYSEVTVVLIYRRGAKESL